METAVRKRIAVIALIMGQPTRFTVDGLYKEIGKKRAHLTLSGFGTIVQELTESGFLVHFGQYFLARRRFRESGFIVL